jgi:hypothetical protein
MVRIGNASMQSTVSATFDARLPHVFAHAPNHSVRASILLITPRILKALS